MDMPRFFQIEPVGWHPARAPAPDVGRAPAAPAVVPAYMNYALFCQLVEQLPDKSELHLQGLGEPLEHLHFFQMVRFAVARGIRVSTHTSLTILPEYRAAECVQSGLHTMHVCLDAASARVYEAIHGKARFAKILRNLRRLMAAKVQLDCPSPHVHLACTVMRKNLAELPALVQLAHDEGIHYVSVRHLHDAPDDPSLPRQHYPLYAYVGEDSLRHEHPQRVDHYFNLARARAQALNVSLHLPRPPAQGAEKNPPPRKRCDWPWRGSYISHDGHANPCARVAAHEDFSLGDLVQHAIAHVWHGDAYRQFRQQHASSTPPEVCQRCALYSGSC